MMCCSQHEDSGATGAQQTSLYRWFGTSKVVDGHGRPLPMYHGTPTLGRHSNNRYVRAEQWDREYPQFDVFRTRGAAITDSAWLGEGSYFTPNPAHAEEFGDFVLPVYLKIERPFEVNDDGTASSGNRFRFLKSLQSLVGLPAPFQLDLSVPTKQVVTDTQGRAHTRYFHLEEFSTNEGDRKWRLLESQKQIWSSAIVSGVGDTAEEAIFNYRYRWEFGGFILHLVGRLGARVFRNLLENNGYDGVIRYDAYAPPDEPAGKYICEAVVFQPMQIKSSLGNCGTFDPNDPSILN